MSNPTTTLLRIIGSPLLPEWQADAPEESEALFRYAFRNNVEMLYGAALERHGKLSGLAERYRDVRTRQRETLRTVCRLSTVLQEGGIPHAVTKTLRPYPGTPNDIDCLYLGPLDRYEEVGRYLQARDYRLTAPNAMQYEFFDEQSGAHFNKDKAGGRFYIDFYRELAADHMPYMDSDILATQVVDAEVEGCAGRVKVLTPIAEMVVLSLHSVLMHRIVPLEVVYTYAYYLAEMDEADRERLWVFARQNHAEPAFRTILTLMEALHREAFGTVPPALADMVGRAGRRRSEGAMLAEQRLRMPHVVRLSTFVATVFSKTRGRRARRGFFKELLHMANPVFAVEVLYHMLSKRFIDRHSDHV